MHLPLRSLLAGAVSAALLCVPSSKRPGSWKDYLFEEAHKAGGS